MNGSEIISKTYAVGYSSNEIDADKVKFADYIDMILPKVADIKAAGGSKLDAFVAFDKIVRGFARKTWGGNEKSYVLNGRMLTVNASTLNQIVELVKVEVAKSY